MDIQLKGMEDTQAQFQRIARGVVAMSQKEAAVGSRRPYAFGIEYGYHEVSGKLARAEGGDLYLTRAVNDMLGAADADLAQGLEKVTAPGVWVLRRAALWVRRLSRENVPQETGRLRRSILAGVRPVGTDMLA